MAVFSLIPSPVIRIGSIVGRNARLFAGKEIPAGTAFNPHLNLKLKHLAQPIPEPEVEPTRPPVREPSREAVPQAGS